MNKIVVAGSGTFGTAIAERLTWNDKNRVFIHSIEDDVIEDINENHQNSKYFPAKFLSSKIKATADDNIFEDADVIMLVIPSKAIVPFSEKIKPHTKKNPLVVNLAKGMSDKGEFITEDIPFDRTASMKGPSFAIETINGYPTSFTFGGGRRDFEYFKSTILPNTGFTLDYSSDVRAVELMSILKNMYAIAIGVVSGKYGSPNVDFLVYTKAANEMRALLRLYGCDENVIFKYCGIGDLGLTALNDLSRNRTLGMLLGKGFALDEKNNATTIEGERTIKLIGEKTKKEGVEKDFPLIQGLYTFLYEDGKLNDYLIKALE